jgi:hypothetical protein
MTDYRSPGVTATRTGRSRMSLLILPLIAFLLGLAAMGWLLANWGAAASYLGIARPAAAQPAAAAAPAPAQPVQAKPAERAQTLLIDPEMQRRVAQLEQRITEIDDQSRAAVGNADRAEGLLVAFAARRALDRGVALGYIEGLLRQRFGETQRQAVATIITASRQPVTLEELQDGLKEVGPSLTGGSPRQDWWTALKAELADVVTVRKSGTPSTLPDERLSRATRRLEAGQVDVALAEVLRLPGRDNAETWIANARRYVAARRALDTIETAALLEPRTQPRPGAEQTAPAPAPPKPSM